MMKQSLISSSAHAQRTRAILVLSHHTYKMIIFVILEAGIEYKIASTMQIPFGMAQAVLTPAASVASTTHSGSVNNYHNQPLTTLR
jgi:hypothetical protein